MAWGGVGDQGGGKGRGEGQGGGKRRGGVALLSHGGVGSSGVEGG